MQGVELLGPGLIVLAALFYATWAVSLYVLVDSVRRPAVDFTGVVEGRWFYAVAQGSYFLVFGLEQIPALSAALPWLGYVRVVAVLPVVVQQVAYLLRVVFPTQRRLDARAARRALESEAPAGRETGTPS